MREKRKKKAQERFLKIPYYILNMPKMGLSEKVLLAHIHIFGIKGCWANNKTLGQMFFVTPRTITTWIANLKKAGCIFWFHPKGRYRTLWSKSHPDVKTTTTLLYMGREIRKADIVAGQDGAMLLGRNLPSSGEEGFQATAKNGVVEVGSGLPPTKNTIREDTTSRIIATPPPLPAGGQAPALLEDRNAEAIAKIEGLGHAIGSGRRRGKQGMTPMEFDQRRQEQRRALGISEPRHKKFEKI